VPKAADLVALLEKLGAVGKVKHGEPRNNRVVAGALKVLRDFHKVTADMVHLAVELAPEKEGRDGFQEEQGSMAASAVP
jgi:hypothetical protein